MNKTITIYELLGLVKDGKAPNKIRFCDEIFTFNNDKCNFLYKYQIGKCQLFGCCKLNDKIEIIEDNDKLEKIKWNEKESRAGILRADQEIEVLAKRTETLKKKIAELVDHINKIEGALNVSKDN